MFALIYEYLLIYSNFIIAKYLLLSIRFRRNQKISCTYHVQSWVPL